MVFRGGMVEKCQLFCGTATMSLSVSSFLSWVRFPSERDLLFCITT